MSPPLVCGRCVVTHIVLHSKQSTGRPQLLVVTIFSFNERSVEHIRLCDNIY